MILLTQCSAPLEFDWASELLKGLITLIFTFIGASLGLLWLQALRAKWVGKHISLEPETHHGSWSNLRVHNGSAFSMRSTYVYVSINYKPEDIDLSPPHEAMIKRSNVIQLYEDRICWALREPGDQHAPHKVALDIHPHERQTATFLRFQFYPDIMANRIAIVSEKDTRPYRVFLKPNEYYGLIKVVSADAYQAAWEIRIDPGNSPQIVELIGKQLSVREYEIKLRQYQENFNSQE